MWPTILFLKIHTCLNVQVLCGLPTQPRVFYGFAECRVSKFFAKNWRSIQDTHMHKTQIFIYFKYMSHSTRLVQWTKVLSSRQRQNKWNNYHTGGERQWDGRAKIKVCANYCRAHCQGLCWLTNPHNNLFMEYHCPSLTDKEVILREVK